MGLFTFYRKRQSLSSDTSYDYMVGYESLDYTLQKFPEKLRLLLKKGYIKQPCIILIAPDKNPHDVNNYSEFPFSTFILQVDNTIFTSDHVEKVQKFLGTISKN